MPEIYVFAGCNGSGKTTLATKFLSTVNNEVEFVNADLIAGEFNPNHPKNKLKLLLINFFQLCQKRLKFLYFRFILPKSLVLLNFVE